MIVIIIVILLILLLNKIKTGGYYINDWNSYTANKDELKIKKKWRPYNIYHAINNKDGYYQFLPSSYQYPDSKKELKLVKKAMKNRTKSDEYFYYLTDINTIEPFYNLLKKHGYNYNRKLLYKILIKNNNKVLQLKTQHNRIRPFQLDKKIKKNMLFNITGHTPAYPAGHAYQAHYLAKYLYNKHPKLKKKLLKIADRIDDVRVKAGIHYPSDGKYAKILVMEEIM